MNILHIIIVPVCVILGIIIINGVIIALNDPVNVDHTLYYFLVSVLSNFTEVLGIYYYEGNRDGVDPRIEEPEGLVPLFH